MMLVNVVAAFRAMPLRGLQIAGPVAALKNITEEMTVGLGGNRWFRVVLSCCFVSGMADGLMRTKSCHFARLANRSAFSLVGRLYLRVIDLMI